MGSFSHWLSETAFSQTIQSVGWIVPLLQSIHILMIGIVFVSSLMIALRVLGRMRVDEQFAVVWRRFAPWMWTGVVVMAATGVLLIIGEPEREFQTLSFWLKMLLVAIGVSSTACMGWVLRPVTLNPGEEFSGAMKAGATGLIVLWLAIIFLGRAIAYDKEVWGALSLHT